MHLRKKPFRLFERSLTKVDIHTTWAPDGNREKRIPFEEILNTVAPISFVLARKSRAENQSTKVAYESEQNDIDSTFLKSYLF